MRSRGRLRAWIWKGGRLGWEGGMRAEFWFRGVRWWGGGVGRWWSLSVRVGKWGRKERDWVLYGSGLVQGWAGAGDGGD